MITNKGRHTNIKAINNRKKNSNKTINFNDILSQLSWKSDWSSFGRFSRAKYQISYFNPVQSIQTINQIKKTDNWVWINWSV